MSSKRLDTKITEETYTDEYLTNIILHKLISADMNSNVL
jgi:hypothetical protein